MEIKEFENWLEKTSAELKEQHEEQYKRVLWQPFTYKQGKKFIKIIQNSSVWGFVSMVDGLHKGSYIKKGDLLKAAGWRTPARHSRGNILDGTAAYSMYGPVYLK